MDAGQVQRTLSLLSKSDVDIELVNYLLGIDDNEEVKRYVLDIVGRPSPDVDRLVDALRKRKQETQIIATNQREIKSHNPSDALKRDNDDADQNVPTDNRAKSRRNIVTPIQLGRSAKPDSSIADTNNDNPSGASKSTNKSARFVPLFSARGQETLVAKLPGRHVCTCNAQEHQLINNCVNCGRIVCEQEGSGPCMFCNEYVGTNAQLEDLRNMKGTHSKQKQSSTKQKQQPVGKPDSANSAAAIIDTNNYVNANNDSDEMDDDDPNNLVALQLNNELMHKSAVEGDAKKSADDTALRRAIAEKDRLIEYDRTSAKRTQVIDDQSDYFDASSRWRSREDREDRERREREWMAERYASRSSRKIELELDFAGRRLVRVEKKPTSVEQYLRGLEEYETESTSTKQPEVGVEENQFTDVGVQKPSNTGASSEVPSFASLFSKAASRNNVEATPMPSRTIEFELDAGGMQFDSPTLHGGASRLQDTDRTEAVDSGWCLSVSQPFATLLCNGYKREEGRDWFTVYRGPVWIASTRRQPSDEDVERAEKIYGVPSTAKLTYPTGVLIGCVHLGDVVERESYYTSERLARSSVELAERFIFVCERPVELAVKLPVAGRPKLFSLPTTVHHAALKIHKLERY